MLVNLGMMAILLITS